MVGSRFGRNAPAGRDSAGADAAADGAEPARGQPPLLNRDTFKPATSAQRARGLLDPVREPRLVRPRRELSGRVHRRAPRRAGRRGRTGDPMRVKQTSPDRTRTWKSGLPPTYINTVTHWWDGSQIYGSTEERNRELRAGEDGKMAIEDGRLPNEADREPRRRRPDRLQRQLLDRPLAAAHAVRQGAQRDLRPPEGRLSGLGRREAVPDRTAGQLGADGEDPHRRVDAGHPRQPGARDGDARQLVRRCCRAGRSGCSARVRAPRT